MYSAEAERYIDPLCCALLAQWGRRERPAVSRCRIWKNKERLHEPHIRACVMSLMRLKVLMSFMNPLNLIYEF